MAGTAGDQLVREDGPLEARLLDPDRPDVASREPVQVPRQRLAAQEDSDLVRLTAEDERRDIAVGPGRRALGPQAPSNASADGGSAPWAGSEKPQEIRADKTVRRLSDGRLLTMNSSGA